MKLGRIPVLDPQSLGFCVSQFFPVGALPVSREWECDLWLDQGNLSSCVGNAWSHYLATLPNEVTGITEDFANKIYRMARVLDDIPGENYEGTSVLAGVKAVKALYPKMIDAYHWCFGIQDVVMTLGYVGPVVLGIDWFSSMFTPDVTTAIVHPRGAAVGGHAIAAIGVDVFTRMVKLRNSWGKDYGSQGDCYISFDDLAFLLSRNGEACVPTGKHTAVVTA